MYYSLIHAEVPPVASHFSRASIQRSHAYLSLARHDPRAPCGLVSESEIHFKTDVFYKYQTGFPGGTSPDFDNTLVREMLVGEEAPMRALWAEADRFAREIEKQQIPFNGRNLPEAYNCRAALIAILQHIGMDFYPPERAHDSSGTKANLWGDMQRRLARG